MSERGLRGLPVRRHHDVGRRCSLGSASHVNDGIVGSLAVYNSLWSDDTITIDRKSADSIACPMALLLNVAQQPVVLEKFISSTGDLARSGVSARALIAQPESTQGHRLYKPAPEATPATDLFNERIHELLNLLPEHITRINAWNVKPWRCPRRQGVWQDYYNHIETGMQRGAW
ncbi:MAG: DUF3987 domain-containing protein [Thiolinea sp.]